jgi:cytochrome c
MDVTAAENSLSDASYCSMAVGEATSATSGLEHVLSCVPDVKIKGSEMQKTSIIAAAMILASAHAVSAQDAQRGEMVFHFCLPCHSIGPGAQNKVGPVLNGLDGRHSGIVPNFSYSDANKNSGIVWNEANFKKYIHDPQAMIPGTKMIFPGIKNDQQVNDLWAYISQFNADGSKKN